ncbi:MAG: endonuclease/exonuclease/phosphatase family protein [Gemmatimonadetes bacterium]|nr:endonuclease/exonuclease/phosphatase family protein [Gemmatimonadota bacterium]
MKTRLRPLWGVAAIPLLVPLVAPTTTVTPERDTQAVRIRVLAYNIKHGEGMDGQVDLERAARVIRSLNPDLVTLQEIDNQTTRTDGIDQAQRLGELTGMHHAFGLFMEYRGGHYGMALLSRYPFEEVANHRLPDGEEPRTALAGRVRIGGALGPEIIFVGIHLYRTAEERLAQAQRIVSIFKDETIPVILAGDFNSTPDSEVLNLLRQSWHVPMKGDDHFTFSSVDPRVEIDFIMYRPDERFELVEYRVIDEPLASDHRPVLMVVEMR